MISPWYHQYWNQWYPLSTWYRMSGTSGIYYFWLPNRLCSSPPLLGFYWNRWGAGGGGGGNSIDSGLNASREWITRDQFSGLGITSAFCPTFFSLFRITLCFYFAFSPRCIQFRHIYSVNDSQETRETWNISRAR